MRRWAAISISLALVIASSPGAWARPAEPEHDPATERGPLWLLPTLHGAGLALTLRLGASLLWPETFDPRRVERNNATFVRSWSSPPAFGPGGFFAWDGDPWTINLLGHGLLGSEIYLSFRQARHPAPVALLMTVAWSVLWEYLIEAWHKHPSGIDLLWTPVGGGVLGEGRYWLYRSIRRLRSSAGRHVLCYLVDPLGQLERDLLGIEY